MELLLASLVSLVGSSVHSSADHSYTGAPQPNYGSHPSAQYGQGLPQSGYGQPAGFNQPPAQGYTMPFQQPSSQYGQAPQQQGSYGAPPQQYQSSYGAPPQQPGFQQQPAMNQQSPYGQTAPSPYGQHSAQSPYGQAPAQTGYGQQPAFQGGFQQPPMNQQQGYQGGFQQSMSNQPGMPSGPVVYMGAQCYGPGAQVPMSLPDYNPASDVEALHTATAGVGTDESTCCRILATKSALHMAVLGQAYLSRFGVSLEDLIVKEMRGKTEDAYRLLVLGPLMGDAWLLHEVRSPPISSVYTCDAVKQACKGLGTSETTLTELLIGRSPSDMQLFRQAFEHKYRVCSRETVRECHR